MSGRALFEYTIGVLMAALGLVFIVRGLKDEARLVGAALVLWGGGQIGFTFGRPHA